MLDTETKRRIDSARDILVGKVPDPKAQVEQITTALIYKFMDDMDRESMELGGKAKFFSDGFEQYSWTRIISNSLSGFDRLNLYSESIQKMSMNKNLPQLFRDMFKGAFLPYRDSETLNLFLKEIDGFNYDHSEKLGDAFEYLLSVLGSQGDAGQFRTPRHIIDFMVRVVNPQKNDTILDPACGTAGFLISAYKHIVKSNKAKPLTPDEKARLTSNFTGYDISPDMVKLSLVNMYLHNFPNPKIQEYDTLTSEDKWDDTFDVVLANPPFMSPKGGIRPHQRFSVKAKRSEVLFVDYIAEHLNIGGRAGIIVPEGIIFQSQNAYKELRKMLVEEHLYAIVSLPAGVFNPYAGVKTSILLMDKAIAKKSDNILFVKIENDGFDLGAQRRVIDKNDLPFAEQIINEYLAICNRTSVCKSEHLSEALKEKYTDSKIWSIATKEKIAESGDYNLSGERYKSYSAITTKWETVELGNNELFEIISGGTPSKEVDDYWNGEINWATLVDLPAKNFVTKITETKRTISALGLKKSSAKLLPPRTIIISSRATIGRVAINEIPISTNQGFKSIVIKDTNKAHHAFIAYLLATKVEFLNSLGTGGTFKEVTKSNFSKIQIPLPPLEIQKEIVEEIEGYQKIIDGARQVVENYKPQIQIDPSWEMVELGEAPLKIIDGDRGTNYPNKSDFSKDGYCLFLNTKNVRTDGFNFDELLFVTKRKDEILRKGKLHRDDVLLTTRGTIGNTAYYSSTIPYDNIRINSGMLIFRTEKESLNPEYLFYFFQSENCKTQFSSIVSGAAQPQLPIRNLKFAKIPIPSLEVQKQIVIQIVEELEIVNANKKLISIFEQKIKDRIAKVWGE